jgi:hypothetical protein
MKKLADSGSVNADVGVEATLAPLLHDPDAQVAPEQVHVTQLGWPAAVIPTLVEQIWTVAAAALPNAPVISW